MKSPSPLLEISIKLDLQEPHLPDINEPTVPVKTEVNRLHHEHLAILESSNRRDNTIIALLSSSKWLQL